MSKRMLTDKERRDFLSLFGENHLFVNSDNKVLPVEFKKDEKNSNNVCKYYFCRLGDLLKNDCPKDYISELDIIIKNIIARHSYKLDYIEGSSIADMTLKICISMYDGDGYPIARTPCYNVNIYLLGPEFCSDDFVKGYFFLYYESWDVPIKEKILEVLYTIRNRKLGEYLTGKSVFQMIENRIYAPENMALHTAERELPDLFLKKRFVYPFSHMVRSKEV